MDRSGFHPSSWNWSLIARTSYRSSRATGRGVPSAGLLQAPVPRSRHLRVPPPARAGADEPQRWSSRFAKGYEPARREVPRNRKRESRNSFCAHFPEIDSLVGGDTEECGPVTSSVVKLHNRLPHAKGHRVFGEHFYKELTPNCHQNGDDQSWHGSGSEPPRSFYPTYRGRRPRAMSGKRRPLYSIPGRRRPLSSSAGRRRPLPSISGRI
jgi:hypothetical protein